MLTRRGLFGRLFGALGAAIVAPWLPKAAATALALRPDAFELAMAPLSNAPITLAPYTGQVWLLSGGEAWVYDGKSPAVRVSVDAENPLALAVERALRS